MIETYEHIIILGMYGNLLPVTTVVIAGFIAWQTTTMVVLYISFTFVLIIIAVEAYVGILTARLHEARIDQRSSEFLEMRTARLATAWLGKLSINFAYVEGGPKR